MSPPLSVPNPSYRSIYRDGSLEGKVIIVTGGGADVAGLLTSARLEGGAAEEIMKDLAARQLGL